MSEIELNCKLYIFGIEERLRFEILQLIILNVDLENCIIFAIGVNVEGDWKTE